jgi:hypothetical protein
MIFSESFVGLRDFGFNYFGQHGDHYTHFTVHNGEGAETNTDDRFWYTARWGWKTKQGVDFGVSGVTGHYLDKNSGDDIKMRIGNLYFTAPFWGIRLLIEASYGDRSNQQNPDPDQESEELIAGHIDIIKPFSARFDVLFRYDILEPSSLNEDDVEVEYTLGIGWSDKQKTSILHLWGIKRMEQGEVQIPNDEIRLSWRLTSSVFNF